MKNSNIPKSEILNSTYKNYLTSRRVYIIKNIVLQYLKEFNFTKKYIFVIGLAILLCYSAHSFFNTAIVEKMGKEDGLFEWATFYYLFAASAVFFILFVKSKNVFFLLLFLILFFGAGEEISWGQRIFNYETPEIILKKNIQKEFNIHNLEVFNTLKSNGNESHGLQRLMELNFLFKVFTICFGILIPFFVFHFKFFKNLAFRFKLPVPPISIGIFFFLNWMAYRITRFLISGQVDSHAMIKKLRPTEIYESIAGLILLMVALFFLIERNKISPGKDIKDCI